MRDLVNQATDRIIRHIETLPHQPAAYTVDGEQLARSLVEPPPESGAPFSRLLDLLFNDLVPHSVNTAGPGYIGYVPGGGLFQSALADFVASSVNRYVGVWSMAPGLVQLEANVVRWFCDITGLPAGAGGFLTSGGSLANFSAIVTARRERLPENFLNGIIYASDQVHHSVVKAAALAGFPLANVRRVATDDEFRISIDALRQAIIADRRAGSHPFLLVASAGTTNTGAVDDLNTLADLAAEENLWLHADGAYGGFFILTARGKRRLAGLDRADSLTLDPHKGLFLPYGTGCLLVRDKNTLRRVHSFQADYMSVLDDANEMVDFCEISPELSRGFRGLRAWLPIKMHGLGVFRDALDGKLDIAEWAAGELRGWGEVDMVAEPMLSTLAFRWRPKGAKEGELNRLNRELVARINRRGNVHMTGTMLGEMFVIRICVLSFRTHRDRVEIALQDMREEVSEMRAGIV